MTNVVKPSLVFAHRAVAARRASSALTRRDILGKRMRSAPTRSTRSPTTTGIWTLRFVLLTLAITPLRRLTGWNALIRFRRMLGLFAFFYGSLHFLDRIFVLDPVLRPAVVELILRDIAKRPYITVGFTASC